MKSMKFFLLLALSAIALLSGCQKDDKGIPFDITGYYVAGTVTPSNDSYTSVYLIKLLENNKAVLVSSGNDLRGEYTLTNDSLVVVISDPNNYREVRFAINDRHELTTAYYKALSMEYKATGVLLKIADQNQFAGKAFIGEEFKIGPVSNNSIYAYKFNAAGTAYGSGIDAPAITTINDPEIINNSAFKFKKDGKTEIGFVKDDVLTVFRFQGLYYFGMYNLQ